MYTKNLCLLPQAEQEAMEEDKQRWFECWKMVTYWPKFRIRSWLENDCKPEFKEDYRRRLNATEETRKKSRK